MIPMTTMSILACYRPKSFTGKAAAKYFGILVLIAGKSGLTSGIRESGFAVVSVLNVLARFPDTVPVLFLLICIAIRNIGSDRLLVVVERQIDYTTGYFLLYATEIALIVTAIRTLYIKTGQLASSGTGFVASHAARRNLLRLVMFSVAPSLLQVPYAIRQITGMAALPEIGCRGEDRVCGR